MPQIVMLNHAASVNYERMKAKADNGNITTNVVDPQDEADPIVMNGKRLSKLNSEERDQYNSGIGRLCLS